MIRLNLLLAKWALLLTVVGWIVLEVWLLVQVGAAIGAGVTILWVIGSAVLGVALMRLEGVQVLVHIHNRLRRQELPTGELLDMGLVLAGALMLIVPGFASDALGLLLLLRPVRWAVRGVVIATVRTFVPVQYTTYTSYPGGPQGPARDEDVIEIERED